MAEDNDDAIPYCIATGDIKKLVSFFTGRGQLREALIIAQVQRAGLRNATTGQQKKILKSEGTHYNNQKCVSFREHVKETSVHLRRPLSTTRQMMWITDNNTRGTLRLTSLYIKKPLLCCVSKMQSQ